MEPTVEWLDRVADCNANLFSFHTLDTVLFYTWMADVWARRAEE